MYVELVPSKVLDHTGRKLAQIALMWPFPAVDGPVTGQTGRYSKRLSTLSTFKWSLAGVDARVYAKLGGPEVGAAAHVAYEAEIVFMHEQVVQEALDATESLSAIRTCIRFQPGMNALATF